MTAEVHTSMRAGVVAAGHTALDPQRGQLGRQRKHNDTGCLGGGHLATMVCFPDAVTVLSVPDAQNDIHSQVHQNNACKSGLSYKRTRMLKFCHIFVMQKTLAAKTSQVAYLQCDTNSIWWHL